MRIRHHPKSLALLALVAALAGCTTVGPKFEKPAVTLNPAWTTADRAQLDTAREADSAWWRSFNDPVLDQLVALAWQQNLSLRTAGVRIAESRAQLALAAGQKWPQVQALFAEIDAVGLSKNAANIDNFDRHFTQGQAGFDVAWEIDFWGRFRNMERAEAARYIATVADYDSALVSLSAEVARTYVLIRTYEALIALAQQNVQLQQEGFRIADVRFRHGATSNLDVTQANTLLESTRLSIPRYQLSLRLAQNALSTLLGEPVGHVQEILGTSSHIPTAPATVAVSMPAELLHRRPDIRSAEFAALSQSARVGVATADLYPRISLAGTIGLLTTGGGLDLNSGFYSIGPRLYLPIFDYGRTKNNIRVEDARLEELLVNYQSVVLRAQEEAEDGLTGFVRSRQIAALAQNVATSARQSSDLAFIQYREGAVDFQRVIEAMRALMEEEISLAQAQSDTATNLISLYKALGGGWEMHQNQPPIPDSTRNEMEQRTDWDKLLDTPPPPEQLNVQMRQETRHD